MIDEKSAKMRLQIYQNFEKFIKIYPDFSKQCNFSKTLIWETFNSEQNLEKNKSTQFWSGEFSQQFIIALFYYRKYLNKQRNIYNAPILVRAQIVANF